jgi:hypothetical protein
MRSPRVIGALFAVGSVCFVVGPFPGFVQLVGSGADGVVFFAGSIFFTTAAALQLAATPRSAKADRLAALVQLAGTLLFNLSTYDALRTALDTQQENRLVWTPDVFGSICFLVSSAIAFAVCRDQRPSRDWWIAALNLGGSVAFGISAIAAFIVPETGTELDLAAANVTTSLGALCFLAGALLLCAGQRGPGPSEPAGYSSSGTRPSDHPSMTGVTTRQDFSASSPRIDRALLAESTSSRMRP